jgi:hypothetical protein
MSKNLARRRAIVPNSRRVERGVKRQKGVDRLVFFDDWIDRNSIGHNPLIYRERVVLSQ